MKPVPTFTENALDRRGKLARQAPGDIALGTGRIIRALQALGHPERRMPPVIHVAGTNGKGSTIAFLRAILEAAGYRVHAFTSPALFRAGEQIAPAGGPISDAALDALADEVTAAAPEPLTPFELLTACAFLAFAREAGDITLIETGLGGRDDATNVITRPALTVMTPISFDHTQFLGGDIAAIAQIKAGIFKTHIPAVIAPQSAEALAILEACAQGRDVALWRSGTEWIAFAQGGRMVYQDEGGLIDLPIPALAGRHQIANAGTAIAAIHALAGLGIDEDAIARGIAGARWPARLEPVMRGPLCDMLPLGSEVWLDGAHNPQGAVALAEFAADRADLCPMPLALVTAMYEDKDHDAFFKAFAGLAGRVVAIPLPDDPRGADPAALVAAARRAGLEAKDAASLAEACTMLRLESSGPLRVLVTGSLAMAALVGSLHAA